MSGVEMPTTSSTRSRWLRPWGATATPRARSVDELLVAVGAGDHRAFATLYDDMAGLVYTNIRCVLHDTGRTDTVADEAFLEVWRQAAQFDPFEAPAVIWILDVAHQLATERDRDDARASAGPAAHRGGTQPSVTVGPRGRGRGPASPGWGCVPRFGDVSQRR
jgi:hypothetical protein